LHITIKTDGTVQAFSISILEDLWQDYLHFKKQAGLFLSPDKLPQHKRYVRVAALLLISYFEGITNRWCSHILETQNRDKKYIEDFLWKNIYNKVRFISKTVEANDLISNIGRLKDLRNDLMHYKEGLDWQLFKNTSLEELQKT